MRQILNCLNGLNSNQLGELHKVAGDFTRSIERLAAEAIKKETAKKELEHRKLLKYEKTMLQKLRLQRTIMTKYMSGYSLDQIASSLNYHPKTIARYIRKYQTNLTILKEVDRDIQRRKFILIEQMAKEGFSKAQIVRKLHISAHAVTAVGNIQKIKIRA